MGCKGWSSLAVLGGLFLVLLVLAGCGSSTSVGDRLEVTFGTFDKLPLTEDEALATGWNPDEECVPQMGKHLARVAADPTDPSVAVAAGVFPLYPVVLMVNSEGKVMGIELVSLSQQPAPPWEHFPDGRPRLEYEHWILHVFLSDRAKVC